MTYTEVVEAVDKLAAALQSTQELKKGDCVAMLLPNSIEFTVSLLAVNKCAGVVSSLNPLYTARKLAYFFHLSLISPGLG